MDWYLNMFKMVSIFDTIFCCGTREGRNSHGGAHGDGGGVHPHVSFWLDIGKGVPKLMMGGYINAHRT